MKRIEHPSSTQYVYISLHGAADVPFERALGKVNKFMADTFDEVESPAYSSERQREMIYRLKRPTEAEEMREFFQNLTSLFNAMAAFSPHFTHYHEGGENGNG